MLLFVVQAISDDPRFMYLFPVHSTQAKTPALDTLILKWCITLSAFTFYLGALHSSFGSAYLSFHFLLEFALATLIIAGPWIFKKIWEKHLRERNQRQIQARIDSHSEARRR